MCLQVWTVTVLYHTVTDMMRLYLMLDLINKLVGRPGPALPPALGRREEVVPVPGTAAVLEPAHRGLPGTRH